MLNGAGGYLVGFEYLINALMVLVIGHKGHTSFRSLGLL